MKATRFSGPSPQRPPLWLEGLTVMCGAAALLLILRLLLICQEGGAL